MKIAIASDHAGFELKQRIVAALTAEGHEVQDFGTASDEPVDYPDYAEPAARAVAGGDVERGILVCGSGVGVAMVANKVDGVRAASVHDADEAELSRRHNDANVLTLGGRTTIPDQAVAIVDTFLNTEFEGGRHQRRVDKIAVVEQRTDALSRAEEDAG